MLAPVAWVILTKTDDDPGNFDVVWISRYKRTETATPMIAHIMKARASYLRASRDFMVPPL
jgi:hypothetical protein